jgi:hypothetical protein
MSDDVNPGIEVDDSAPPEGSDDPIKVVDNITLLDGGSKLHVARKTLTIKDGKLVAKRMTALIINLK